MVMHVKSRFPVTIWSAIYALACLGCSQSDKAGVAPSVDAGALADATTEPDAGADAALCTTVDLGDPMRAMRNSCTFAAGAKPGDTLGITEQLRKALPIKHVIVLMKENRSFDHIFGRLSTSGQPNAEAVPATWASIDANGMAVPPHHETTTCVTTDPPHQWAEMHAQSNGGKMDGFVKSAVSVTPPSDGLFTMGYLDATDIPFYYWLANTFSVADRHFPSVLSGTWANRDFLVAGTSKGTKDTAVDPMLDGVPLIFDKLEEAKVTWEVYTDDIAPLEFSVAWGTRKKWKSIATFLAALKNGTLPAVTFVDSTGAFSPPALDEHPPGDVQVGEAWTRSIYQATVASPVWSSTALFFTYDEAGGFGDHVPPPKGCAPSADQSDFTELGIRVPLVLVSPWAKRHHVSHEVHEHTSILRFIELLHDLPALTARDANSDALLDMFDFSCANTSPLPTAPAAGVGRCK